MSDAHKFKVPILTYHSIDENGSVISTSPAVFQRQMKSLSAMNYNVISLDALMKFLLEKKLPPKKTIALTFDDGFQNFYTTAFPVLENYGFKATVFLVTDFCGKFNGWAGNPPDVQHSKMLCWNEVKELSRREIEFGAHTRTHPDLTRISSERIEREMIESKAAIENKLGCEVTTFAYPFGKFNPAVKQAAKKNFKAACSTNLGKVQPSSDFFSLERVDSFYLSNQRVFNALSTQTFDFYMSFRQIMREFKSFVQPLAPIGKFQ